MLLEVDHEQATEAGTRSRPSPNWSARPSTCTPTGSPRWGCGTRGPPGTTRSRSWTRCSTYSRYPGAAFAAGRHRRDHGPLRPAPAGEGPAARAGACAPATGRAGGGAAGQEDPAAAGRAHRRRHRGRASLRARAAQAGCCSSSAGRRRTSPATSTARPHPIDARRGRAGRCGPTRSRPPRTSGHGGSGVVVLPCGAGKTLVGAAAMAHGPGDDADPGHQHGLGAAVEATSCSGAPR